MTRAERRYLRERAKQRADRNSVFASWLRAAPDDAGRIRGIFAKTRKLCDRACCSTTRRHHGPSVQERRALERVA